MNASIPPSPRVVARSLREAASALGTTPEVVARLLLRGRVAPAVLLPTHWPAFHALALAADEIAQTPAAVLPAVEDEAVELLLRASGYAPETPHAPEALPGRAGVALAPADEAGQTVPDPLFAVRIEMLHVIGRELRLLLSTGAVVVWPVDRHPGLVRVPTEALQHIARWRDPSVETLTWGTDDAVPLVAILRDPATRPVPPASAASLAGEP